jgi:hypothetical protein
MKPAKRTKPKPQPETERFYQMVVTVRETSDDLGMSWADGDMVRYVMEHAHFGAVDWMTLVSVGPAKKVRKP